MADRPDEQYIEEFIKERHASVECKHRAPSSCDFCQANEDAEEVLQELIDRRDDDSVANVIVVISGGVCQDVIGIPYILVDYDNIEGADPELIEKIEAEVKYAEEANK